MFVGYAADWKWFHEAFRMTCYWAGDFVCQDCHVRQAGPDSFTVLHPDHPPYQHRRTNAEFMAENWCRKKDLPGLHLRTLWKDWLHVAPLGIIPVACGCTLEELCAEGYFGDGGGLNQWKSRMIMQLREAFRHSCRWQRQHSMWFRQTPFSANVLKRGSDGTT